MKLCGKFSFKVPLIQTFYFHLGFDNSKNENLRIFLVSKKQSIFSGGRTLLQFIPNLRFRSVISHLECLERLVSTREGSVSLGSARSPSVMFACNNPLLTPQSAVSSCTVETCRSALSHRVIKHTFPLYYMD